jgi:hypothetical protein
MAKDTQLSNAAANAEANALARLLDNGYRRVYDGSKPATADTAITSQVLLAELRFAATSAPAAVDGVLTFTLITDSEANANGTAAWYRDLQSNGTTVVMDGTVGTSDANLNLSTTSVFAGQQVAITSATHTVAKATAGF